MRRPTVTSYLEAALALTRARVSVLFKRSKHHFAEKPAFGTAASENEIIEIRRVLAAASRRLPFRTLCYEQALAARSMLAHREISSRLNFGAGKAGGNLTAHVWLTSGDHIVVGEEEAALHVELARSPE